MKGSIFKMLLSIFFVLAAGFFAGCADSGEGEQGARDGAPAVPHALVAPKPGAAATYSVLAGTAVTNTGGSTISGELGVSPGNTISGLAGSVSERALHVADLGARQAQRDAAAISDEFFRVSCMNDLSGRDLGGLTLSPGVYCVASAAQLTGSLTLDAQGDPNALFLFKIGTTLSAASNSSVVMINKGANCNVHWLVGSSATLGAGSAFIGNIHALAAITLDKGATLSGRALVRDGTVTLDTSSVSLAKCPNDPDPAPAPSLSSCPSRCPNHTGA